MSIIYGFLVLVEAVVSAMLIGVILLQKSKGGMGGAAFGGGMGEAIFGSRMGNVLTRTTVILGGIFLCNTLVLTSLTARRGGAGGSVTDRGIIEQPATKAQPQPSQAQPATLPATDADAPLALPENGVENAGIAEPIKISAPAAETIKPETLAAPEAPKAPETPAAADKPAAE